MRLNIHYKINLIFGSIVAIILFGIYIYLNSSLQKYTYRRIETNLLKEISLSKSFVKQYYTKDAQSRELDKIADKIGEDLGLRVTIIKLDGTVLGDSELNEKELKLLENHLYRPEVQQALHSGTGESRRFSTKIGRASCRERV